MSAPRATASRALFVGPLLVIAGLVTWALYVNKAGSERHSYSRGANPPTYVRLVAGNSYSIAIHGGVDREVRLGVDPSTLQCTAALPGQSPGALELVTEQRGSKATDRIATFVSAISGSVQIQCNGIGTVYVDDAADAPFDVSGVWLALTSLALLVGLPLTLSGLRRPTVAPSALPDGAYAYGPGGLALPPGVTVASTGRRIGAYFLAIPLAIVTLVIGYLIWGLVLWGKGTTPALQVLGMKCYDIESREVPGFGKMALREIVGRLIVEGICIIVGIVSFFMFIGDERRSLHDKIGGTIVLHDPNKVLG